MSTTINFPDSPTIDQEYTYGNVTYRWDGEHWNIIGEGIGINLPVLTNGDYLTGGNYDGSQPQTWDVDATSENLANKVVARDGNGKTKLNASSQTTLSASPTTNINLNLDYNFYVLLNQNITFSVSNVENNIGKSGVIILKQDGTGGRTFTNPTEFKTPLGGAAIAQLTGADTLSMLTYYVVDASTIIVNYIGDFA